MLRPFVRALAIVLCFALPSLAGDLTGLWAVEGTLPDGRAFSGHAVLAPQQTDGRYTLSAHVRLAGGDAVRWQATATHAGAELSTRHWRPGTGISGVLGGAGGPRVVGHYTGTDAAFSGGFGPEGQAQGQVSWARLADPLVRFEPEVLALEAGAGAEVVLRADPEGLEDLLWIDGPAKGSCSWYRTDGALRLEARRPGAYTFTARLGRGGPELATLELDVRTDAMQRVLARVVEEANDGDGLVPLVIFDLDDTLFDTRYRTLRILHEYAALEHEVRLETLQPEQVHYELSETLLELGYSQQEIAGGLEWKLRRFWLQRFFSDARLSDDRAYDGAVAYLHALIEAGAEIAYVTGRKTTALSASRAKITADGYPTQGQHFFFKPVPVPGAAKLKTSVFKGRVAGQELPQLGEVVAAFDNEPSNCNAFMQALPEGSIVIFLDTLHETDAPALLEGVETVGSEAYR